MNKIFLIQMKSYEQIEHKKQSIKGYIYIISST